MPAYLEHARAIADALRGLDGVTVVPDPPQTPMLHLLLATSPEAFKETARELAGEGLWTWPGALPALDPRTCRVELSVGEATCGLTPAEVAGVLSRFVPPS
jgi:hypothetical protein